MLVSDLVSSLGSIRAIPQQCLEALAITTGPTYWELLL